MAVFVGSNSDDSRIRSNRVGFAASTSNPGSASEGDAYYNSGDSKLNVYDGSSWIALGGSAGTLQGTLSGSLSDGQPVIIKSDGNLAGVTTSQASESLGNRITWLSAEAQDTDMTFDEKTGQVIIVYKASDDSDYATSLVGTVSGSSIGFGTASYIYPGDDGSGNKGQNFSITMDTDAGRPVILYTGGTSSSSTSYIKSGFINGNRIIFSDASISRTEVSNGGGSYNKVVYDSANKRIVAFYRDAQTSKGEACVLRLNGEGFYTGESGTYGNPGTVDFSTGDPSWISACYDSDNEKVIIAFSEGGNSNYGTAIVGTVDPVNFTIRFGTPTVFNSADSDRIKCVYDTNAKKVVIVYQDQGNSSKLTCSVGTVSGDTISFGSKVVVDNNGGSSRLAALYHPLAKKVMVLYRETYDSNHGWLAVGSVSGTSALFAIQEINASSVDDTAMVYDPNSKKVLLSMRDFGNSQYGTIRLYNPDYADSNVTSDNFIGFSAGAYTNGQTASVQIEGTIDDAQTGLTTSKTHYVQNNGTLSTDKDFPVVEAGTAISGTKIAVKG